MSDSVTPPLFSPSEHPSPPERPSLLLPLALLPLCLVVGFLFFADRFFDGTVQRDWWWGGMQLWSFATPYRVAVALLPLVLLLIPTNQMLEVRDILLTWGKRVVSPFRKPVPAVIALIILLWLLRSTRLIIGDSEFYITDVIPREALSPIRGMMLNYDSIGTTVFYSRGFRYAHKFLAMDVLTWYNVFGLLCLGGTLLWIWANRAKHMVLAGLPVLALIFAGNWSQATLGAPEHYGQVLLCSLIFAILAVEALEGRAALWKPCLAFSIGAFFHLIIGWLLPALIFLLVRCWKNESREGRRLAVIAMALPAFLTGYLCYFFGFDISFLTGTNSSKGKIIPFLSPQHPYSGATYQYSTFDLRHLAHIGQEILLMGWPGIVAAVLAVVAGGRRVLAPTAPLIFLLLMFCGTLMLNLLWNPDLGFWRDQDLFSIVGLSTCLLGAWLLTGPAAREHLQEPLRAHLFFVALTAGILWRVPVILWHGILSSTWLEPEITTVVWPFGP